MVLNLLQVFDKEFLTIDDFQYAIFNLNEVFEALTNNKTLRRSVVNDKCLRQEELTKI